MLTFLIRRVAAGLVTLVVALFGMFLLVDRAIDPLADLRESTAANKEQLIEQRIIDLDLNTNVVLRALHWFGDLFTGDLGESWRSGQPVAPLLSSAIGSTLELVTAAIVLSLVLGIAVGVVSALRQYTVFDYSMIFLSFLLYSLPSFWLAVLLKQWVAIGFNDFLQDPVISWTVVAAVSLLAGLLWMLAIGGDARRRLPTFAVAAAATAAVFAYLGLSNWWLEPQIGPVLTVVLGAGVAVAVTAVSAGLHNRRALLASLTVAVGGGLLWFPLQVFFDAVVPSNWLLAGLGLVAIGVGLGVGHLFRGPDPWVSGRAAAITAFCSGAIIAVDQVLQVWPPYTQALRGRPIATFGDRTPNLGGNYWVQLLDAFTHLLLPTATLTLIAFAAYTRYARSSMLEVLNQDYIRTARAKGLPERLVIMRHGFRNSLIPLATVVPIDIVTLIGGAVIIEAVFARPGMGQMFIIALGGADIDPVMAYLLVTAALAIAANIVADIVYAVVDPRIRLDA